MVDNCKNVERWWNGNDDGFRSACNQRKTCASENSSTINPTWTGLVPSPGLRGIAPASSRSTRDEILEFYSVRPKDNSARPLSLSQIYKVLFGTISRGTKGMWGSYKTPGENKVWAAFPEPGRTKFLLKWLLYSSHYAHVLSQMVAK